MSKNRNRDAARGGAESAEHRLARLLDTPLLARIVPHLPPETLHGLIRHHGLDACGELVTAATPAQLASLLDLDLWRHGSQGGDEQFDVDRFGEWLEVLVETGDATAARTIAALDPHLVVAGLSRYVRVFDPGIFEPTAQSDDEPVDRHEAMREGDAIGAGNSRSDRLECEMAGYIIRGRRADAWDAIVALLAALDAADSRYFQAVMQGCRRLSNSRPEEDGLDALLLAPVQHLHEVTVEREQRRSQQGYATPADAHAFLEMARRPRHAQPGLVNPIVAAYFRAAEVPESAVAATGSRQQTALPSLAAPASEGRADADVPESIDAVLALLAESGVMPERPRALLDAADVDPQTARLARLRGLLAHVRETDENAYLTRSRELAFLANALLAGCLVQSRPFTPQEASDAAAATCNLGLEYWPARWQNATASAAIPPGSFLIEHDLVTAFEVGWSVLHQDVSLLVADQLIAMLSELQVVDAEIREGLAALRRTLAVERDAGTPWRAREAGEVLAMLDMTAWASVVGLLGECPVLPAALTAILESRATAVDPHAFDFFATPSQIGNVRAFMRRLPDVLFR